MDIKSINLIKKKNIMDIDKFIYRTISWQNFRDFFNITIFKYFVTWFAIFPIAAKILEKIPNEVNIPFDNVIYTITIGLPFKWQILWFASLSFVFAYILYVCCVPKFITKYFNYKYYKEYEHSPRNLVYEAHNLIKSKTDLEKFVERMLEKKYIKPVDSNSEVTNKPYVGEKQTILIFNHNSINYELALPILDDSGNEHKGNTIIAQREIYWEIFGRLSACKVGVRITIFILLVISLIAFLIPFGQSICSGIQYFIK